MVPLKRNDKRNQLYLLYAAIQLFNYSAIQGEKMKNKFEVKVVKQQVSNYSCPTHSRSE